MHICIDGRSISHPQRGGFKTYIENLVSALADLGTEHEFTVVYDRPYRFPPLADNPRFREEVIPARLPMAGQVYREQVSLPLYAARRSAALWHFPYNTAPAFGAAPYVLTLHDVTPFTHAARPDWSQPLRGLKELALFYYPRFLMRRSAQRAAAVITVSGYARQQIIEKLGIQGDKVFVTPLAAQDVFRPLSDPEKELARRTAHEKYGLERPFLLTVASSLLKNPQGVVAAYARLPVELRANTDLVIVMAYERARSAIEAQAVQLGVAPSVRFLIGLEPEQLLLLYNLAEAFVYLSFTESFGLPPLEAMACGVPVIASRRTAMPEVLGDAALLVDPTTDTAAIAEAIAALLTSPSLAEAYRQRGLSRSRAFSWQRTASQTLDIYRWAISC